MSALSAERLGSAEAQPAGAWRATWFFGPCLDAILVANVTWPLVALAQASEGFEGRSGVQFWQLYFVTTPHRWITLGLVFLDRDRFSRRPVLLGMIAFAVLAVCLGVRFTTGALTCLLTIDYLWNAWHFAAQHHGVYRIYGRLADGPAVGLTFEKGAMRLFLLYVIVRVASATWSDRSLERILGVVDWGILAVPVTLLVRDLASSASPGRTLYLVSVCSLYLALLGSVHERRLGLVLALATASALFHAIEYLALASWSVRLRHARLGERLGLLGGLAARWGIAMLLFLTILGASGWLLDHHAMESWLTINVVVAFLHYAYDGVIWRRGSS